MESTLFAYSQDEKVLCYHGPLIYEAKILDRKTDVDSNNKARPLYKVHYLGWNKKWNEWVEDSRILLYNKANLNFQKHIKATHLSDAKSKKHPTNNTAFMKRKRTLDERHEKTTEMVPDIDTKPDLQLSLPEALKVQLVDDWEKITLHHQLVPLPRSPTITQIMAEYKTHRLDKTTRDKNLISDLLDQVIHGLCMYFNAALSPMLLYGFERRQHNDLRKSQSDKDLTDIYGAEHLLRLFIQLPNLIAKTQMGDDTLSVLHDYLGDMVQYILKMQNRLFVSDYLNAPPSYVSLTTYV